jgi:hypothetical protein
VILLLFTFHYLLTPSPPSPYHIHKSVLKIQDKYQLTLHVQSGGACGLADDVDGHTGVRADVLRAHFKDDQCVVLLLVNKLPSGAFSQGNSILKKKTIVQ